MTNRTEFGTCPCNGVSLYLSHFIFEPYFSEHGQILKMKFQLQDVNWTMAFCENNWNISACMRNVSVTPSVHLGIPCHPTFIIRCLSFSLNMLEKTRQKPAKSRRKIYAPIKAAPEFKYDAAASQNPGLSPWIFQIFTHKAYYHHWTRRY